MVYNPNIHHRTSIRLKGYDYSQAGLYFITLCCQDRANLFGDIKNDILHLNAYGKIAATEWANTENIRDNVHIHEYIIMPNHIHGIIEITGESEFAERREELRIDSKKGESKFDSKEGELGIAPSTGELQFAPTGNNKFKSPSQTIGAIIRGYKIATIKKIKDYINKSEFDLKAGESGFDPDRKSVV